ncbi:MAG: class I SAM-dependent methyltransferase [Chloroflexota bacterium]
MDSKVNTTQAETHQHASWYKRLFARMMNAETESSRLYYGDHKRSLLGQLHGTVLEIGPGTGPNLPYYSPDIQWIGIEPNPAMFPYIEREAQRLGLTVQLREGQAERLDAADASVDAVVATLVLCSVRNPQKVLQEILRVLKPGGRFVFIEHVAAPPDTKLRRRQNFIRPFWRVFADGCEPTRETWTTIEQAGFDYVKLEHFYIDNSFVGPHIAGVAVK